MLWVAESRRVAEGRYRVVVAANERRRNPVWDLDLRGIDFTNYRRNPVVLYNHDDGQVPVGRTVEIGQDAAGRIVATFEFLPGDPFAERVKNAWDMGFLRAASIRWLPLETDRAHGDNGRRRKRDLVIPVVERGGPWAALCAALVYIAGKKSSLGERPSPVRYGQPSLPCIESERFTWALCTCNAGGFLLEISFAFLCDYADTSGGKLTAVGIGLDTIYAAQLPANHPLLYAVIGLRFSSVEPGQKKIGLRVIDADGRSVVPPIDGTVNVEAPPSGYSYRTQRLALALRNIQFPTYGDYAVAWLVEGQEVQRALFKVAMPPPTTPQEKAANPA
ncbi:MAG: hypothetical protein C1O27_001452 [Chloroflexi bacterium]|jgi:hypothetical protein|nr:MAG: hypothetical protein C1O27_001452 [Chloroflexota bacterium]